jgi:hypothetical protein
VQNQIMVVKVFLAECARVGDIYAGMRASDLVQQFRAVLLILKCGDMGIQYGTSHFV